MKRRYLTLFLLPIALTGCSGHYAGFDAVKNQVDTIEKTKQHPYYRVIGALDFNNEVINVDATFDKQPDTKKFVPYSRYTEGFYCSKAGDSAVDDEEQVLIYGMASHSYWLRMPLKIDKINFFGTLEDGEENPTSASYVLKHLITIWMDEQGAVNPSACKAYFDLLPDGGFAVGGNAVHTKFKIDNYPYYPDPVAHPEAFEEWAAFNPLPAYKSVVDAKVNVRFEYDADGWLKKEYLQTLNYDYNVASPTQVSLISEYYYKFSN